MHFALHMAQEPVIEPPQHASDDQANDDAAILQEPSSRPSNSPRGLHRCHAPLPADGICPLLQSLLGDAQALWPHPSHWHAATCQLPAEILLAHAAVARTGNRTMVALSGMHTDDRERYKAILRRLGISCSSGGR